LCPIFLLFFVKGQSWSPETSLHRNVLTIGHLELQDAGMYTCIVSNKLDKIVQDVLVTGLTDAFLLLISQTTVH